MYIIIITSFELTGCCLRLQVNTRGKWPSSRRTLRRVFMSAEVHWSIRCTCSLPPTASRRKFQIIIIFISCYADIHTSSIIYDYLIRSYTLQVPRTRLACPSGWVGRKPRRGILPVRRNRRCQYGHPPRVLCGHVVQRPGHTANGQARRLLTEPTH